MDVMDPIDMDREQAIKTSKWVWHRSIGLYYGYGPQGQVASVVLPRMTSPWWIIGYDGSESDVIQIYRTSAAARRAVEKRKRK